MLILKVCHTCDCVLGELETDDLTSKDSDSIMSINGNVAYALCPECLRQLETEQMPAIH